MKRALQIAAGALAALVVAAGAFVLGARPIVAAPSTEVVERTPERLTRGTHLAENAAMCMHCHSGHDDEKLGLPIDRARLGAGGLTIDEQVGFPGSVTPPNITPDVQTGIGAWTDGEVMRAIREGVSRDGRALFPMMPYRTYASALTDEDVRSIVVYLRALPPRVHQVPPRQLPMPLPVFIRFAPKPVDVPAPELDDATDHAAYGARLVARGLCIDCHSQMERGQLVPGMEFAGGREFMLPRKDGRKARVVTANITTDPETGYFGRATKDAFIARVRSWGALRANLPDAPLGTNTLMPWLELSNMSDADLGAIFDHMKTVKPVKNVVVSFPDAPGSGAGSVAVR